MTVVKTLEINLVQVDPRSQIFQHLGRGVAIRDKAGDESGRSGFLEYRNRPLTCDERFVVGTDEYFAALGKRVAYQRFWAGLERR